MSTRDELQHATELLERLLPQTTPRPWRDSTVDSNKYGALVTVDRCVYRPTGTTCDEWSTRLPDYPHPHDGYGGCLVGESMIPTDRRLMAVMRNVTDWIPLLLRGVLDEDPIEVGAVARAIAAAIIETHTPRTPA